MTFIIETEKYNILHSGSLIVPNNEPVIIRMDNLNFRFSFHKDENVEKQSGRFEVKIEKDEKLGDILEIKLYNMKSSFFGTPNKILQVGHYGGYILYLQFSLMALKSTENGEQQLLFYTFYQDKTKKK